MINVIKLNKKYFFEEFEHTYSQLSLLFPPEEMENRNFKEEEYIEKRYKNIISSIHNMEGYTINWIKCHIKNNDFSSYLDASFFYLGITNLISRKNEGFYFFEYELMFNRLNVRQLEEYIDSLYLEEHLEIMQSTYTLSKAKKIDRKELSKLVVTNPYTKGLKDIMFAFVSESKDEKHLLYKRALLNLSHIKYYYLEALYFYCKFLKESEDEEYLTYINEGVELSKKYFYQNILHLFDNLYNNRSNEYNFAYSFYQVNELETYVNKHNTEWERILKEREMDY